MTKILVIAGHGENKNGSFDPGATGIITKGEHKYYEQDFFPAVKKFLPSNSNVVLYSEHNVYDYKDLVALANKYGKDTIVIEMHYDAGASSASGGHVIVHADYEPDKYDLAIRDFIKKHIGVRYTHKGQAGISGRTDLGNCNRAKTAGINYRLVELGFGTNKKDASTMVNNIEAIAKDFVQALIGKVNDKTVEVTKPTTNTPTQTTGKTIKVGTQAKKWQTGSDIPKFVIGQTYDVLQEKAVSQSKSKKAYLIGKGTVATGWLLEQDVDGFKSTSTPACKAKLVVDGYLGVNTIKVLQTYFGTVVDGKLSKPSLVIKSLQKLLGVTADGLMGPNTIKTLQKRFGTPQDGKLSEPSMVIKELQRRLNAGKL